MNGPGTVTARAPASIGNLGVGFDILGLAFDALHDRVTVRKVTAPGVRLARGVPGRDDLPADVKRNTALRAADAVLSRAGAGFGVEVAIDKGIPLSAGLGGSAASAVAAAVAVNALLPEPLAEPELFDCALEGERASSDPPPPDNVAACLYGGLVLMRRNGLVPVAQIPVPNDLVCVAVHPRHRIGTAEARAVLPENMPLVTVVAQTQCVASFILGCATSDRSLISEGLKDFLVEPFRAGMIPGFTRVKAAALRHGALGCSLSGSGPTVFAWAEEEDAAKVGAAMREAFEGAGLSSTLYSASLFSTGAEIIDQ